MASLAESILQYLANNNEKFVNSLDLAKNLSEDHQKVVGAIKSIQALGELIQTEQVSSKEWELTPEGKEVVEKGSHEALVYHGVPASGISQAELMKKVPNAKIGFSKAMSNGWIHIDKSAQGGPHILRKVDTIDDVVQQNLFKITTNHVNNIPDSTRQEYKKRKLLQEVIIKSYNISKGPDFTISLSKPETDLTPEMIATGAWKDKKFKEYNFEALGIPPTRGHLHPLMRVRAQFRQIFLEMGFSEMPTNNFVESSFWNFDALFQPQQHPARDAHDTFFVSNPMNATQFPMDYLERVKKVHQYGDFGSQGYKYEWKIEEARKNLLRTHTTAVSARMLYKLAQQGTFKPVKYFSIDRVFRNETLDATHLAEFFQIEGVVADYGLTLGDLIGVLHEFFKKLGITKLRFKPAYNPYTEPSMEVFSYHEGLKKWVEVGNSGLFRPELLLPMGLPKGVKVIAWGLSLERPTMIKFGIDNIRDLVGHKVNLQMVYDAPICRLDKNNTSSTTNDIFKTPLELLEERQEKILKQLTETKDALQNLIRMLKQEPYNNISTALNRPLLQMTTYQLQTDVAQSKDIVIHTSVTNFPLSVLVLSSQLGRQRHLVLRSYKHSSVQHVPHPFGKFLNGKNYMSFGPSVTQNDILTVTFIFTECELPKMSVNPTRSCIIGENNIARYFARHLNPPYDSDPAIATCIDDWLDQLCESTVVEQEISKNVAHKLESHLRSCNWLVGNELSLADIVYWSMICKTNLKLLSPPVIKWLKICSGLDIFEVAKKFLKPDCITT